MPSGCTAQRPATPGTPIHVNTSRVRVRYAETDKMGVVYYANYFVWFEVGRTELLRSLGWSYREMESEGVVLPVVEAHCEYLRSVHYEDDVDVRTSGTLLSATRLRFDYELVRSADQVVVAIGRTVHVSINADGRACRLPERVRTLFT